MISPVFIKDLTRILLLFGVCSLLFLIIGAKLHAQDDNPPEAGLSISPVVFELTSDPGDTLTNQIKTHNPTDYPQTVKMLIEDFTPVGEEGDVVLEEPGENSTYSLASWTTVTPSEYTLQPGDQQIVNFTIEVPQNAEPGGHYGSIVASISGGGLQTTGTGVGSKRGALVLLRVSGNIEEEIVVNTFDTEDFQEYGPVDFDIKFENTGNVHVRPAGFVTITNQFGKQVAQLEIPENNVIPGAIRQANVTWDEKDLIGHYTATLVANYGSTDKQTVTDVTTFTVFPWKKAAGIAAIVIIILLLIYFARDRIALALKVLAGKK